VNPEAALAAAVPARIRRQLPERIQSLLEERVSGWGWFGVLLADDFETRPQDVRREVILNHRRYEAFVYGSRLAQATRRRVSLHGIAIGTRLALHQDPVRRLEAGESVTARRSTDLCPVSNRPATVHGTPVSAEVGDGIEHFCGIRHLELLNQRLAADLGDEPFPGDPLDGQASWTQGPKTCLFMRVAFPEDPTAPISEDGAYALMDAVNQWYTENSYATTSIIPTVTPLLTLPQPKAWYAVQGTGALLADARQAAREAGYDTDPFDWDIVRHGSVPGFNYGGLGYVGGKGAWLQSSSVDVAIHELGHNYGLWHANFWSASGDSVLGPGAHVEYGNSYDAMGVASAGHSQFNAAFKHQLAWLPDSFVQTVTTSGTYRVYSYDVPALVSGHFHALKIRKDYDRNYWAEHRRKFSENPWSLNGLLLNWDPWNNGVTNSGGGTHLLDTTPGTPGGDNGREDAALVIGRTFSDPAAGIHLTPIARGNNSSEDWIDVIVNLGWWITNAPPTLSLTADSTRVAAGSVVNFSTLATDPEGDPLAYAWDFGDATFGSNSAEASKTWFTNGEYVVHCTVSDCRGGLSSQNILITVGQPGTFRLSGRITSESGEALEGVRVHNGLGSSAYRGTSTDSAGRYVLANLPEGTNFIAAVKYGHAFSPQGWSQPVVLGPNLSGLDWNATASAIVTVAAPDPTASESGADSGTFRISRTGATDAPLTVKFNRTGSALWNTDFSMTPTPTGSPSRIILPAGAASVDIVITPLGDSVSEGPETVTVTLIEDASCVLAARAEATVTIIDADPVVRPTVTVSANGQWGDSRASESGSDGGSFWFTRTDGSLAGELIVRYTLGGSATPGVDYASLPGVVSIAAGESSTAVPLRVIDDADVETNESVTVTVLADGAYTGAGGTAAILILDDDPTTVTLTATDNTAREGGGNNGTFTVTRQGSLAANLLVHYSMSGTASNGSDYVTLPGTVIIPSGRATATLTVTPVNDSLLEGDETVLVSLASHPACNVGNPGSATVTLIDDELPAVTVVASDATAHEAGPGTGRWTFTRTGATSNALVVYFDVGGTAVSGADYAPLGGGMVIPSGTNAGTLILTPLNDSVRETDEKVMLTLRSDPTYSLGTTTPQTISIKDDDGGLPGVGFTFASSSGPESDTLVPLSVGLSTNSASTVTVHYNVTSGSAKGGGVDYTLSAGNLAFPPGVVNQSINLSIIDDSLVETNESLVVTLSNPSNALLDAFPTHRYTILDDDASGAITVTASDAVAAEDAQDAGIFRISRSGGVTNAQIVYFETFGTASAPSDYAPPGRSVIIPKGSNTVTLVVVPVDDAIDETNETIMVKLTSAPGARIGIPNLAIVTILDNDDSASLPVVTVTASDATASEPGANTGTFTLRRDRATNAALTVQFTLDGTARSGTDFIAPGTNATIPAGAYETKLPVTALDDGAMEPEETVILALTVTGAYRVGAPATATVTLLDNESGAPGPIVTITSPVPKMIGLAGTQSALVLEASAFDEGQPGLPLAFAWSRVAGPGPVLFENSNAANTTVRFSAPGIFVLRLTAHNGPASGFADLTVAVNPEATLAAGLEAYWPFAETNGSAAADVSGKGRTAQLANGATLVPARLGYGLNLDGADASATFNSMSWPRLTVTAWVRSRSPGNSTTPRLLQMPGCNIRMRRDLTSASNALAFESQRSISPGEWRSPGNVVADGAWSHVAITYDSITTTGSPIFYINGVSVPGTLRTTPIGTPLSNLGTGYLGNSSALDRGWDGQIDELRIYNRLLGAPEIAFLAADPPPRAAPFVAAGPSQAVAFTNRVALAGVVSAEGEPALPALLTAHWTKRTGPGVVTFADPSAPGTFATFSSGGQYVLRLIADDGQVQTADDLTLTLTDSPWDNWRLRHFSSAELTNAAISGELADPDGDGIRNLFEYAFNFDPRMAEDAGGFSGALERVPTPDGLAGAGRGLVVTYKRRLPPTDLLYDVQWSSDFTTWTSAGPQETREFERIDDGNGLTETVKIQVFDPPLVPLRFLRLKLTRK